jgi:hypothetical protein
MGFFALVVVPAARRSLEPVRARELLQAVGARLGQISWWLLGSLLVSGFINLWARGLSPALATLSFWGTTFGRLLAFKLTFVAAMTFVSAVHGRDARRHGARATVQTRLRTALLGRATFGLSLVVVTLAVILVRGLP